LAACVVFVVWSAWLMGLAHLLHRRVDANARLLNDVAGMEAILHRTEAAPAPPLEWTPFENEYHRIRENMERGNDSYWLIQDLIGQVDRAVTRMAAIQAGSQGLDARPEAILERRRALEGPTGSALAATGEALARLQHDQTSISRDLTIRWDQMEALVLGACAFAALLAFVLTERRQRARALRESVSLVNATLGATADGILVLDLSGRVEGYNDRFLELWRIPPSLAAEKVNERLVGFVADQLIDPDEFRRGLARSWADPGGETRDTLTFKDGRIFERYTRPRRLGDEVVGLVRSFRDITDRKHAEESLRLMESIVVNTNDAVVLATLDPVSRSYQVIFANAAFTRETGYAREDILGKDPQSLCSPNVDRSEVHRLIAMLAQKKACRSELLLCRKDGGEIWAEISFVPILDPSGAPTHVIGIGRNATERKRMEQELRILSRAIEQCPVTVVITDLAGSIEYVNPKFTELTGYALEEVRGRNPRVLKSGDTSEDEYRILWETIRTGEWRGYFHNRKKNGELFWEAARICPIRDSRGNPTHYLAVKEDITDRRRIEDALAQAKESAEAASLAKSEFLANMSHEIRTPMNGIIGFTQLTLQTSLDTDQRDYLETVESSAQALLRIINDILDFSKIEAGHLELEREPFSLRETVAGAASTIAPEALRKGLDLSWDVAPGVPDALLGDATRLRQVLLNLLGNAAKFTAKGLIRVEVRGKSAEDGGLELHFVVKDSGIGIPPAQQRLIFEPFRQADGTITRKYGGTGLGLAISARLVRNMRGTIWVESQVGHGSAFHFTACFGAAEVPREAAEAPGARGETDRPSLAILVVEDDLISRTLASTVLTHNGHSVATAANGVEALWLVERRPFDVILMDVQMPQMDGFEATERIRRRESRTGGRVPIVAMTAHAMKGDRERCLAAGMDDYISKPLDLSQLLALLGTIAASKNGGAVPGNAA
jgi:PAS domain S-box-containing protein